MISTQTQTKRNQGTNQKGQTLKTTNTLRQARDKRTTSDGESQVHTRGQRQGDPTGKAKDVSGQQQLEGDHQERRSHHGHAEEPRAHAEEHHAPERMEKTLPGEGRRGGGKGL